MADIETINERRVVNPNSSGLGKYLVGGLVLGLGLGAGLTYLALRPGAEPEPKVDKLELEGYPVAIVNDGKYDWSTVVDKDKKLRVLRLGEKPFAVVEEKIFDKEGKLVEKTNLVRASGLEAQIATPTAKAVVELRK